MGNCRFPLYVSKTKAAEWFDIWRLKNEQRVERYEWSSSGPDADQASLHPTIALFHAIAESNHLRARRRFLRAQCLASQGDNVGVWEDDVHPVDPSDDESIPAESQEGPLNLPTYFPLPLSSLDPRLTAQSVKRPGETMESGSTKEPRTDRVNPQQDESTDPKKDPPTER